MSDALNIAGAIALGIIIAAFAIAMFVGLPQMRAEWHAWRTRRRLAKAAAEEVIIWPEHPPAEEVQEVLDTAALTILENTMLRDIIKSQVERINELEAQVAKKERARARHWKQIKKMRERATS